MVEEELEGEDQEDTHENNINILNIEIPETGLMESEKLISNGEKNQDELITFEEMRRQQYVVQGPNTEKEGGIQGKEESYQSSGIKRGQLLVDKVEKKRQEVENVLESIEERTILMEVFDDIELEIQSFINNLERNDFESVGMNLYKQNSKKYSEDLQTRLMEIEEKYQNLEKEMIELKNENEKMRRTQEELQFSNEFEETQRENYKHNNEESIVDKRKEEHYEEEEDYEEDEMKGVEVYNGELVEEDEGEREQVEDEAQDSRTERQKAMEDMNKEITGEINEMIFDLLEVIEDVNISTVEKMKVIRIFLHHTHDLLGTHEQMHFIEQSRDYNTEEGSHLMQQFPTNPIESDQEEGNDQQKSEKNEMEPEEQDKNENETNLECWEEKLEVIPDGQEDYLSREIVIIEEKQLTEIKEDDGSEDYDSQDPKNQIMNNLDDAQERDFREERGYSSLEVLHDRTGETEVSRNQKFEHENYESAKIIRDIHRVGEVEQSLHDQVNELKDEKIGLKNKNIMLNDKISFLNQKLTLLETRLEEMEKSYLTVKSEKKEFWVNYEAKSKELKQVRLQLEEVTEQKKFIEEEMGRLTVEVEKKSDQVKDLLNKIDSLHEINGQLVAENELKSQELIESSLIRSSMYTGNTPLKNDSERNGKTQTG